MSSGSLRRGCVGVLLAAGLAGHGHAGPTRLDDLPPVVDNPGSEVEASVSQPAGAAVSGVSNGTAGASVDRVKREPVTTHPGEKLLRPERLDAAFSAGPSAANTARGTPQKIEAGDGRSEDNPTKELAAAALAWMHEVLPWGGSKPSDTSRDMATTAVDGVELPADIDTHRTRSFAPGGAHLAGEAHTGAGPRDVSLSMPPATGRRSSADPAGENSLRALINFGREVVSHPLTWLVVLLIGIGHIVLSLAGRGK